MDVLVMRSEVDGVATPPPSKSYTHRAFLSSALSRSSRIYNPLISDDTLATLSCCRVIGADFVRIGDVFHFRGCDNVSGGYMYCANSGTTLRLFLGIATLSPFESILDGDESLRKRPNLELVRCLRNLGANVRGSGKYEPPVWVRGIVKGGEISIEAKSSQFVSSLLFTLPLAKGDSVLKVLDVKSRPYIDITLHVLEESGIKIEGENMTFYIEGEQDYRLRRFFVPSDFSSASYLIAAGVLAGKVIVENVFDSRQGDKRIVDIVREMGGKVRWNGSRIVAERSELEGVEVDAGDIPDLVPTIAVLGSVAKGRTVIYNAEHLRLKEIDRIEGIYRNLGSLGVEVKKRRDGVEVIGGKIVGGVVDSFGDHRMALAFSLLGLVSEKGVLVKNAEVVSVSFPNYFDVLRSLGANLYPSTSTQFEV